MRTLLSLGSAAIALLAASQTATADPKFHADPFAFVGTAAQCGGTAGHNIITAGWLEGMGLPDDGSASPGTKKNENNDGLLLNKNGLTTDCSAAGAEIKDLKKKTVLSEIGFDYRGGGHCGAGATRFNVVSSAGDFYFVGGCQAGTHSPAPQDSQWSRVRFGNADFFPVGSAPPFVLGTTQVDSITLIHDEGTDSTSAEDPNGVGLAVLDNIDINGSLITEGGGGVKH